MFPTEIEIYATLKKVEETQVVYPTPIAGDAVGNDFGYGDSHEMELQPAEGL
jgi:hypothetical protein